MNQNVKMFVLDVDGVIFDSTEETLVVAWNAYQKFRRQSNFITRPEQAPQSYAKHFRSVRNYNRVADEYLHIFFSKEGEIRSQADYEKALSRIPANQQKGYAKCFFEQRALLKNQDLKAWIRLHRIYPGIIDLVKQIKLLFPIRILTGKDKESIVDFFELFRIPIIENHIYDKEAAKNKMLIFEKISQEENIPYEQICFLDDNIHHLIKPRAAGIKAIMAGWGYGLPEHHSIARAKNIPIMSIPQLTKMIKENKVKYV